MKPTVIKLSMQMIQLHDNTLMDASLLSATQLRGRMVPKTPAMHAVDDDAAPTPASPGALARERRPSPSSPQYSKHPKVVCEPFVSALSPMSHESDSAEVSVSGGFSRSGV